MNLLWKRMCVVSLLGSSLISSAAAAQSPSTDSWTGPYLGVLTGIERTSGQFSLPGDTSDVLVSDKGKTTKWFGGLDAGFNYQTSSGVVVGLEGDITAGKRGADVTACTTPDGCWTPAHDSFTTINHLTERAAGHLRAEVGFASGANLFYAAGGYSLAKSRLDLLGECFNAGNPATPLLFTFSRSKTISGFNLGAGYERRLGRHFGVRAEYVYDDFGHQLYSGDGAEWNDRRIAVRNSTLRLGLDFRFF